MESDWDRLALDCTGLMSDRRQIGMDWHKISTGFRLDWHRIGMDRRFIYIARLASNWHWNGAGLATDSHRIGMDWQWIGIGLASDWHQIGNGSALDWPLIDIRLALD